MMFKSRNVKLLCLLLWLPSIVSAEEIAVSKNCLAKSINEIQIIGSHNSYRRLPPSSVLIELEKLRPGLRGKLEYEHPPLDVQLDLGLRLLELDFYADPKGGLFSDPPNFDFIQSNEILPFDEEALQLPGFKVMHIQGYDNFSHCLHLKDCLKVLKKWSDSNPEHTLITLTMNVKEDQVFDNLPKPLKFNAAILDELDALMISIFGKQRILRPDDVRGNNDSLREAVVNQGWPKLSETKQKFMFVLDEATPSASLVYRKNHPSLKDRVMFAQYPVEDDEASFMVFWDINGHEDIVSELVNKGFLVRVSSDIGTKEARLNDKSRLNKAINSGAQFIASDYYPGHISPFNTDYLAQFSNGATIKCQ